MYKKYVWEILKHWKALIISFPVGDVGAFYLSTHI